MKELFDEVSLICSRRTTQRYSTSFSLGIRMLDKSHRNAIYSVYGFVRFADEIVDSFHDFDKRTLLARFRQDTVNALHEKISLNPILNSFQKVFHAYKIEWSLVDQFLKSMEMDLDQQAHDRNSYDQYILGSAEVVGLMCLRVFVNGNTEQYEKLQPYAMKLGAAFQKINFLRDIRADYSTLGRTYFPELEMGEFNETTKRAIELEIESDFKEAYVGILKLPKNSRLGVYLAYRYYTRLFKKIRHLSSDRILKERIRISNRRKLTIVVKSYIRHNLNML